MGDGVVMLKCMGRLPVEGLHPLDVQDGWESNRENDDKQR